MNRRLREQTINLAQRAARFAIDKGLLNGQRGYRPFVILGRGRTGSNFLASLLRSHGHVVTFGELFNQARPNHILWEFPGYRSSPADCALRRTDAVAFIERRVFGPHPPRVSAVGFKLFYYHAREDACQLIWPYLKARQEVHVVHLTRQNLLRTFVSEKVAKQTRLWSIRDDTQAHRNVSVELDHAELEQAFSTTRAQERACVDYFVGHPKLELTYEALATDTAHEMERVQTFLGVTPRPLFAKTRKQARMPLAHMVTNYPGLKERFAGTPWGTFFDE
ncbi:MAG: Stf0 family sulfotransferase [Gammaproteobacteria bacterium]|nr:Stf0 family sulfotransferase [Gammaproteobacteria bacterium]